MNSGHDGNWSVDSWKESVRLTMVNQESVFKDQLKELHRIYKKQVELMEEMGIGQLKHTTKGSKKPKLNHEEKTVNINELITRAHVQVGRNTDAPVTPETTNRTTARGKLALLEDKHARSAADTLVAMSADSLLWFAKIATSVKRNADLASVQQKRTRKPRQRGKEKTQEIQMPGQHGKCQMGKKRKGVRVVPCISSWGKIKNGRRSKRIPDRNPLYTFQRGAFLC
ncbi:hypothetical protein Lser_V15G00538 [Lactuca serriola]